MQILPLYKADLDLLLEIQPHDWADIRIPISFYLEADYCFPFKAVIDGVLVGTGTATLHEKTGWLSTIITHPDYRNQGIGKQITEHLLAFLQSHSCNYIYLIATALGEPVYSKAGFVTESRYAFYRDVNLKTFEISENIIPYNSTFKEAIFELDLPISGEDRSQHLESFLADSFVFVENEEIEGVYFQSFGDGLIVAKNQPAGIELMKKRLQKFDMASFPKENNLAQDFMRSHGYTPDAAYARMHYGLQMPWQPQNIYNRVGGKIG
jgi:GNAT superfamily N-acetyltransferase